MAVGFNEVYDGRSKIWQFLHEWIAALDYDEGERWYTCRGKGSGLWLTLGQHVNAVNNNVVHHWVITERDQRNQHYDVMLETAQRLVLAIETAVKECTTNSGNVEMDGGSASTP